MHRIDKTQNLHRRLDMYDVIKYSTKRKKLTDELFVAEKVLALAEQIKKKAAPGKFYKRCVQNISYFNKDRTFIIRKIQPIDGIRYYWLKATKTLNDLLSFSIYLLDDNNNGITFPDGEKKISILNFKIDLFLR